MFYRFFCPCKVEAQISLTLKMAPIHSYESYNCAKGNRVKEGPKAFANLKNKRLSYFNASRGADDKFLDIAILACAPLEKQTRFLLKKNLVDAKSCLAYIGED